MEVCGTHTMAIFRNGLKQMMPKTVQLISGPGCPVCVTPSSIIDGFIELAGHPEVIITTFGDMIRVPGSNGSLADARAEGARVEIVYSPMDSLVFAKNNLDKQVVFLSVGFETTTPTIAATVLEADRRCKEGELPDNFSIFPANKIMGPPLKMLMEDPDLKVDGLLCPGHVSIVTGSDAFKFLVDDYGLSCAVAGFEPTDILRGIIAIVEQVENQIPEVANCYSRIVSPEGNLKARQLVEQVFRAADSEWRGLGNIPDSGMIVRDEYKLFDTISRFNIQSTPSIEPKGCECGEILKGIKSPPDCQLFGSRCTPTSPVGPCMVSAEGTCAAWHRYLPEDRG
jgi:hydrogenase expression/formation protein HypD